MDRPLPTLDMAALSDIGLKRQKNEDNFGYQVPPPGSPEQKLGALFIVADGMGGMGGGDVASQTAVQTILTQFYADADPDPLAGLRKAIEAANVAVREQAASLNRQRIGATAAGLLLLPDSETLWFNVGDARVYRIRQGKIEQVSHDQSVLQLQLDAGYISEEDARIARNVNVTAFIGQATPVQPVYRRAQAHPDDVFVLCSDGLWDLVQPDEIAEIVRRLPAQKAVRKLIALARKRGAPDNVTVTIVRVGPKPHGRGFLWLGLALIVLALIASVVFMALSQQGDSGDGTAARSSPTTHSAAALNPTHTPGRSASSTAGAAPTDSSPAVAAPSETHVVGVINIATVTPVPTRVVPTGTPTTVPSRTPTERPTATYTPSSTRTASRTPSNTPSTTPTVSATPTVTSSLSRTPTATPLPPSDTPSVTRTPTPSNTPFRRPTSTLNPTLITWTPSPRPSPSPTLSPEQLVLSFAAQDGVFLVEMAAMRTLAGVGTDAVTVDSEVMLDAGTRILVLSDIEQPDPDAPSDLLREVRVLDGTHQDATGWLSQAVIGRSVPIAPRAIGENISGTNVRRGDSMAHPIVGILRAGESARILGVSSRGTGWYMIELASGQQGWVSPGVVQVSGDTSRLVAVVPPPPPPPTHTPDITGEPPSTPSGEGSPAAPPPPGDETPAK